jgi:hypothetical protein
MRLSFATNAPALVDEAVDRLAAAWSTAAGH